MFNDYFGNIVHRVNLRQGPNHVRHDALIEVPLLSDKADSVGDPTPLEMIPPQLAALYAAEPLLRIGQAARTCHRANLAISWMRAGVRRQFAIGSTRISNTATARDGRIFRLSRLSNGVTAYAAILPIARWRCAAR